MVVLAVFPAPQRVGTLRSVTGIAWRFKEISCLRSATHSMFIVCPRGISVPLLAFEALAQGISCAWTGWDSNP